ncbi:polysaccharide biosynthesis/export family protein [Paraburkholderia sp. J76]|uniref:polysaccharide biosynthesis/export family protein n=1 Tax=Paraburkholderia sp. J76 TaxID=2805439 RepID=UPI002ABD2732|nr:polysaccharide biosynthesis/export family protein [Paraburkholderia sp. J76]
MTLAACMIAPGMRMSTSATGASTGVKETAGKSGASAAPASGESSSGNPADEATSNSSQKADATQATPEVPVTELDIGVVKRLREERVATQHQQAMLLGNVPSPYAIGIGDVLQVVVWDHPELAAASAVAPSQSQSRPADPSPGFVVDQSGDITFPYAGTIHVVGLRPEEVQKRLVATLGKYFVKPQVTVRMASYRAHEVYVDGAVHTPGSVALNDVPMSLYEAVSRAGGFADTADQSDLVLVRGGETHRINMTQMLASGLAPSRLYLKAGDMLRVTARDENDVYVMGEVNKPISAIPQRNGRITLADALSQAGSVNATTADAAQMFVIRGALDSKPQVFHLDGRSPVAMLVAKEFDLQPKDVVYVDGSGLVRFSRVLSLLLPAINAGMTAGILAK